MSILHNLKHKRIMILILAFVAILTSAAVSIAAFTDRADRTATVQTASFDDEGYSIERTAPEGYFAAGESIEMSFTETNSKSENITSQITMNASWESPVPNVDPWHNATITLDGEDVPYTVNENNTISFTLDGSLKANSDAQRTLTFQLPSELTATGDLKFSFEQILLSRNGWSTEYDNTDLSELDYGFGAVWNISQSQTTSLGNPNRDVIALLTEGTQTGEYGLRVMKNPYSSDDNTNNGAMLDWAAKDQTPWANYSITNLTIGDNITTIGDYAFAEESGITSVSLPNTITHIGTSAFDSSGLEGELIIPASVTTIDRLAFGNLPNVNAITFKHGSDDLLTLPNNEVEGEGTSGAFYVSNFVKTIFDFNGNSYAKEYNWTVDNRAKKGISDIELSYSEISIGETANPSLIIAPSDYDTYESIQYKVVSGGDYIEFDESTGAVTGKAVGSATIQVTIVDANGNTVQSTANVTITAITITNVPSQSGSLTYTGSSQSPAWSNYDSSQLDISGTTSGTNAGSYSATFTPKTGYQWSDGSTTAKTVSWTIGKAAGSLSVSPASLSLDVGSTDTITVTHAGDGTIAATSGDTSIATVSVSGATVTATGKTAGTATITISVAEGTNHTAPADKTVSVTVEDPAVGIDSAALTYGSVAVNGTATPTLKINPSNYTTPQSITYSVYSGTSYASVNSSTGVVTGKANGNATIKVTIVDATGTTVTAYCVVIVGTPTADVRYVWSKYNTITETVYSMYTSGTVTSIATNDEGNGYLNTTAPTYTTGQFNRTFSTILREGYDSVTPGDNTTYYIENEWSWYSTTYTFNPSSYSDYYTIEITNTGTKIEVRGFTSFENHFIGNYVVLPMNVVKIKSEVGDTIQGSTSYGYITSTSSTKYPDDGASGSYWYVYEGFDRIDPTKISYSTTSPTAGSSITASVTARSNTYGGTISYQYQYSTDGGKTWTTSGTTTAKSKAITVPSGAASFMVRVRASDNYGFTSANYVYGTNLVVN